MAAAPFDNNIQTITIDEATLKRLREEYGDLIARLLERFGPFTWGQGTAGGRVDLSQQFSIRLAGNAFPEAAALNKALEAVRLELVKRFGVTYDNGAAIYYALYYLLQNSEAVETLNKMTAEEFRSWVPREIPPLVSGTGTGTSGSGTSGSGTSGGPQPPAGT